jgi:hypothetical protein
VPSTSLTAAAVSVAGGWPSVFQSMPFQRDGEVGDN